MTITERDKKILVAIVPLLLLAVYWFLLLAPKREEAAKVADALAQARDERDQAVQQAQQLAAARNSFAADYQVVVRLGKAIPDSVDMPSLIVQIDRAARGAHVKFDSITPGERGAATLPAPPPTSQGPAPVGSGASAPANAGGAPAQSGPGKATEAAGNAVSNASDAAARSGLSPSDAQTSVDARAAASSGSSAGAGTAPGLESVPIQFQFTGSFFDLADFLHRLKRFVHLRGDQVVVHGRLMTVDRIALTTPQDSSRRITAQISATAYLSPKSEGVTAGATPSGPAPGTPAPSGTQTASSSTPPTAVVTR